MNACDYCPHRCAECRGRDPAPMTLGQRLGFAVFIVAVIALWALAICFGFSVAGELWAISHHVTGHG